MTSDSLINTDGFNWTVELLKVLSLNSEVRVGVHSQEISIPMICGYLIPLTSPCVDAARGFDAHSKDCLLCF